MGPKMNHKTPTERVLYLFTLIWGTGGVALILGRAILRISEIAREPFENGQLEQWHWIPLVIWTIFMAYSEGYRGFQKKFSPRVVARAEYLGNHPTIARVVFAPLICMGLVLATKKRLIVSWSLIGGIFVLVLIIQTFGTPWRGIIDFGVVVGLTWGLISLLWYVVKALMGQGPNVDPEMPHRVLSAQT